MTASGTGEVLGRAGLWNAPGGSGLELEWTVRRSVWGRGIATEAARAALAWGWTHLEHDEVLCVIHATNAPSVRIAEKLGARLKQHHGEGDATVLTYCIARPSAPTPP